MADRMAFWDSRRSGPDRFAKSPPSASRDSDSRFGVHASQRTAKALRECCRQRRD
jgi:hypothetical protein